MAAITAAHIFFFHTAILPLFYYIHSTSGFYLCCAEKMVIVVLVSQAFSSFVSWFLWFLFKLLRRSVCACVCVREQNKNHNSVMPLSSAGNHDREEEKAEETVGT